MSLRSLLWRMLDLDQTSFVCCHSCKGHDHGDRLIAAGFDRIIYSRRAAVLLLLIWGVAAVAFRMDCYHIAFLATFVATLSPTAMPSLPWWLVGLCVYLATQFRIPLPLILLEACRLSKHLSPAYFFKTSTKVHMSAWSCSFSPCAALCANASS